MFDWKNPLSWNVLVVDDEPDNLDLIVIYLSVKGAQIRGAHGGPEALAILKSFQPNLILLDLSMPHMSGWDVLKTLQADPQLRDVRTIALTAHAMPADREKVREAGFHGYLTKPVNLPTLFSDLEHSHFAPAPEPAKEPINGHS